MTATAVLEQPLVSTTPTSSLATPAAYRLRPIMRQGTASSIAETWVRFASVDEARRASKGMYHDDRVLRVFVVTDGAPPQFVEWIER